MQDDAGILEQAADLLKQNDRGHYVMPNGNLYPHQWLWDSCFIAVGLRHLDVERAKQEVLSLFKGQWSNGMVPHIIFNNDPQYRADRNAWRSWVSPYAPKKISTTGITQPPLLAEAVVRIGEKLEWPERRLWYQSVWEPLVKYHQWLYTDRDPHSEGLVLQIHPWETGLDNTPPWMDQLQGHQLPGWIRVLEKTKLINAVSLIRRDTRSVPLDERFTNVEVLALFDTQRRLRRKNYDIDRILDRSLFAIEDLAFNSIFIRANEHLCAIAKSIREDLPEDLSDAIERTKGAFHDLYDPLTKQYYSRDFITHNLIREQSVATLLPLYAGTISKERAHELVKLLENERYFGTPYPAPSVPVNSSYFDPKRYWQGPTWVNMNWLIIDGLERYGFMDHAEVLRESTIELVEKHGFAEYFNPLTGEAEGAHGFSWTAALTIDLLHKS